MFDLEKARFLLEKENCTCVICRGENVILDHRRGIRPLMELLESGMAPEEAFAKVQEGIGDLGEVVSFINEANRIPYETYRQLAVRTTEQIRNHKIPNCCDCFVRTSSFVLPHCLCFV